MAPSNAPDSDVLRFGIYDLDPVSGELRRSGMRVRLSRQPLLVLLALLEVPGRPVSRERLRHALWGDDTFVDFEHGLNFAVTQLRRALGDRATSPRFIETLPTVGYRFVAPVTRVPRHGVGAPVGKAPAAPPARASRTRLRLARGLVALAASWLALQSGGVSVPARTPLREPPARARDAYLKGLYHSARSTSEWPEAEAWLRRAVAEDPDYGVAQGALAGVYVRLAEARLRPGREVLPLARAAAAAALHADQSAAEAHLWSGLAALYGEWDWATAGREIRTALALEPDLSAAHRAHAAYLSAVGDADGAVAAIDRARVSDPLCPVLTGEAGWYRYCARRYDEAATLWRAAAEIRPSVELHEALVQAHRLHGDDAAAAAEAMRAMRVAGVPEGVIRSVSGRAPAEVVRAYSRGAIAFLERAGIGTATERLAVLHAALGDHERALVLLERACDERSPGVVRAVRDPALDALRADLRFRRLLHRLHIPS